MVCEKDYFPLAECNEISRKCFSHTLLGPGVGSCDLRQAVVFLASAIADLFVFSLKYFAFLIVQSKFFIFQNTMPREARRSKNTCSS